MPHDEPSLFDLPLAPAESGAEDAPRRPERPAPALREPEAPGGPQGSRPAVAGELPLFPSGGDSGDEAAAADDALGDTAEAGHPASAPSSRGRDPSPGSAQAGTARGAEAAGASAPAPAGWTSRLLASLADGAFLGAAIVGGGTGAALLGVWPGAEALGPLALFAVVFSFVYSVVPLAFWGRTPGMAAAGLVARDADGGPLTFGQTGLRWLGGLLTLALAGLPLLLALGPLGGRSLADRLSGSRTWRRPSEGGASDERR